MKNISKLTLLIIALSVIWAIITVVIIATGHILTPLTKGWLIAYVVYSIFLIIMLTLSLNLSYERINKLSNQTVTLVLKKSEGHNKHIIIGDISRYKHLEHRLYMCPTVDRKYCTLCAHSLPHEHTEDCDKYGCQVVVKVLN
jgi:hypothetical protein